MSCHHSQQVNPAESICVGLQDIGLHLCVNYAPILLSLIKLIHCNNDQIWCKINTETNEIHDCIRSRDKFIHISVEWQ